MNWKQILPGLLIGGIAIYALLKLSKGGGGSPGVYNALVPSGGTAPPDSRDPARTQAYSTLASVGVAQLGLAEKGRELDASLELARDRFGYQITALGMTNASQEALANIQNNGLFARLQAELADRQYDRELQQRAIDQTYALVQSGQIGQTAGNILGALLNAIGRGQQQSRSGGGSGGGSGTSGGATAPQRRTVPQMSAAAYNRLRQNALMQAIFGGPDPTGSGSIYPSFDPQAYLGFADPGGFFDNYSGQNYSDLQQGLDWWSTLNEPQGFVTSDFEYLDFFSGGVPQFDRSLPVYEPTYDEWYDNFGWLWDEYY